MTVDDDALAALTERVRHLEERIGELPGGPATESADGEVADGEVADGEVADGEVADGEVAASPAANPFWILEGLEQRMGQHAIAYAGSVLVDDNPVRWQMSHDSGRLLELDWAILAPALNALGHPSRLHILQLIARGNAATAADLAGRSGLGSTGQIYHHLRQLVAAGWLQATTKGRHEVPAERLVPLLIVLAAGTP